MYLTLSSTLLFILSECHWILQRDTNLSVNPERATLLIQFDGSDSRDLPGLLNVASVAADSKAHQVLSNSELLLEGWSQLLCALEQKPWHHFNGNCALILVKKQVQNQAEVILGRLQQWCNGQKKKHLEVVFFFICPTFNINGFRLITHNKFSYNNRY